MSSRLMIKNDIKLLITVGGKVYSLDLISGANPSFNSKCDLGSK